MGDDQIVGQSQVGVRKRRHQRTAFGSIDLRNPEDAGRHVEQVGAAIVGQSGGLASRHRGYEHGARSGAEISPIHRTAERAADRAHEERAPSSSCDAFGLKAIREPDGRRKCGGCTLPRGGCLLRSPIGLRRAHRLAIRAAEDDERKNGEHASGPFHEASTSE